MAGILVLLGCTTQTARNIHTIRCHKMLFLESNDVPQTSRVRVMQILCYPCICMHLMTLLDYALSRQSHAMPCHSYPILSHASSPLTSTNLSSASHTSSLSPHTSSRATHTHTHLSQPHLHIPPPNRGPPPLIIIFNDHTQTATTRIHTLTRARHRCHTR